MPDASCPKVLPLTGELRDPLLAPIWSSDLQKMVSLPEDAHAVYELKRRDCCVFSDVGVSFHDVYARRVLDPGTGAEDGCPVFADYDGKGDGLLNHNYALLFSHVLVADFIHSMILGSAGTFSGFLAAYLNRLIHSARLQLDWVLHDFLQDHLRCLKGSQPDGGHWGGSFRRNTRRLLAPFIGGCPL
jgi:hypothetical protein